ncbi:MAG: hypothetical protein M3417_05070 [Actinomycetota bacterium]|nr:hypothetical protein [Actinomycetota bacterium]
MARPRTLAAVLGGLCFALGLSASQGVSYGADRPTGQRPDTAALSALGVKVSWPLGREAAVLRPGSRLVVRVRRTARRAALVRLTFARVSANGLPLRRLSSARLRNGTFTISVPRTGGEHFALSLRAGSRSYRGWIDRAMPAPAPPAPAAAPAPPPAPPRPCQTPGTVSAEMRLDRASAAVGDRVGYTLRNTGSGCLLAGLGYGWERLAPDGTWVNAPLPPNWAFPSIGITIPPGTEWSNTARVPADFEPGHYRLKTGLYAEPITAPKTSSDITVSAEIDIVAAASP